MLYNQITKQITKGLAARRAELSISDNEGSETTTNVVMLPKDMKPCRECFEKLGFLFKDIGDDILLQATLPEGWSIKKDQGSTHLWYDLFDQKGQRRGTYCYKNTSYDRHGQMELFYKYRICFIPKDTFDYYSPKKIVAIDSATGDVLFEAGCCNDLYSNEHSVLVKKVVDFLYENYPEWRDVTKYWD